MKKLFLSVNDSPGPLAQFGAVAERLGVAVTHTLNTPYVLPLTNGTSMRLVRSGATVNFMPSGTYEILTDSVVRQQHFPALPATQDAAAVRAITGPVFVKPRRNEGKGSELMAYTRWASGEALYAQGWEYFTSQEQGLGGLVAVPDIGNPMSCLELDFSVNEAGDVYVMHVFTHGFTAHNRPTTMVSGAQPPSELVSAVETFCKTAGIKGGIFNIQAVEHDGAWKVMDWNTRPSGFYSVAAGVHPGVADAGVAHLLSLPVVATPVHIELRSYWDKPFKNSMADAIRAIGLTPSWVWDRSSIGRIYGIGDTAQSVHEMFAELERLTE